MRLYSAIVKIPIWKNRLNGAILDPVKKNNSKKGFPVTNIFHRQLTLCSACLNRLRSFTSKTEVISPVFLQSENFTGRLAIIDRYGKYRYEQLLHYAAKLSRELLDINGSPMDLDGERVAFLVENDMSYVATIFAIWMAGGIAVPLCKAHPESELEYFVKDSQSSILVTTTDFQSRLTDISEQHKIHLKCLTVDNYSGSFPEGENEWFSWEKQVKKKRGRLRQKSRYDDLLMTNSYKKMPAVIVYTSGTTGKPKGVVLTHGNLHAMITGMIKAWGWRKNDIILNALPLHHVHGLVNALLTPLYCGAACVMLPKFDANEVWSHLLNPIDEGLRISVFMGVPTMYAKLIENFNDRINRGRGSLFFRAYLKSVCKYKIRLMVSGSAPLPLEILKKWEDITGHVLLERYGMTEIGMALTNPLHGHRIPGAVGNPFPNVQVRIGIVNFYCEHNFQIIAEGDHKRTKYSKGFEGDVGELLVKGPSVFNEYWNRPEETKSAFCGGWFKTGDTAVYENHVYKIRGRTSVDIIKSGGYKISALDIENCLIVHPLIVDCAVIGLPDITWGQKVAAVVVLKPECSLELKQLKVFLEDKLPPYQIPSVLKCLPVLPRNTMGKLNKKDIAAQVFPEYFKSFLTT